MTTVINSELAEYFFGPEFNVEVANHALNGTEKGRALASDLNIATVDGEVHCGLQLVCYTNLDDGMFVAFLNSSETEPSVISHFISSNHRFFGGQTLLCVPFQFCTDATTVEGEYLVYRHTFKKPILSADEYAEIMSSGSDKEKLHAFQFLKSRNGYQTIPGKSYVGMTKRHWGTRYVEHVDAALSNSSSTLFHKAIREMQGKKVVCIHDISAFGVEESAAKEYEKQLIKISTLSPMGLNMKVG